VWIRRNATTDLATPEEIARLASGQSLQQSEEDRQKKLNRESFSQLSQHERQKLIVAATSGCLRKLGYGQLPRKDWANVDWWIGDAIHGEVETRWKTVGSTAIIVYVLRCVPTLTGKELRQLYRSPAFDFYRFVQWDELPTCISELTRVGVKSVRRLCIVPLLRPVPASRIEKALPALRRTGNLLHYYERSHEKGWARNDRDMATPSSSELLILDGIRSVSEYKETLVQALESAEGESSTIVVPPKE
jgi:hypothetical protein